jgi:hypothetical protein
MSEVEQILSSFLRGRFERSQYAKKWSEILIEIKSGESIYEFYHVTKNHTLPISRQTLINNARHDLRIHRRTYVSVLHIIYKNQILMETKHEYSDGTVKYRNSPPSEKLFKDESYFSACNRIFIEELGIDEDKVKAKRLRYKLIDTREEQRRVAAYPGVTNNYTITDIQVELPEEWYQEVYIEKFESNETYGRGRTAYFEWKPIK